MSTKTTVDELLRELEAERVVDSPERVRGGTTRRRADLRRALSGSASVLLLMAAVVVGVAGSVPFGSFILYPFSLFVTLVHESGHAVVAMVTGGMVFSVQVSPDLSGLTVTGGGSNALIASAGYLGATLTGVALLLAPLRRARWTIGLLTIVPISTVLLFHPATLFTTASAVAFAAALGVAAWGLPIWAAAFLQIVLGVAVGLNAFRDLMNLVTISELSSHISTDAANMSQALFLPPLFWAVLWTVLSVGLLAMAVLRLARRDLEAFRRQRHPPTSRQPLSTTES